MFGSPALLVLLVAGDASATPSPACPNAEAVWAGVEALVGARLPPGVTQSSLQIDDLGDRYRVSVAGRTRDVRALVETGWQIWRQRATGGWGPTRSPTAVCS